MMWMVNTWAHCPTSTSWDSITRALLLPRQRENRLLSWKLLLLCLDLLSGAFLKTFCNFDLLLFQGLSWKLFASLTHSSFRAWLWPEGLSERARRCTCRRLTSGQLEERSRGKQSIFFILWPVQVVIFILSKIILPGYGFYVVVKNMRHYHCPRHCPMLAFMLSKGTCQKRFSGFCPL